MDRNLVADHIAKWKERSIVYDPSQIIDLGTPRLYYHLDSGKRITVAAAGELMIITGTQKSRKTMLTSCMMMSNYIKEPNPNYTLNFEMSLEGRPMIYYDTEQPKHRTAFNIRKLHKLCKLSEQAKGFYVFNIKPLSHYQMLEFITHTIQEVMQIEGQEPGFMAIDQVADLAKGGDVNDPGSMDEIYTHMCQWHEIMNDKALISPAIHTNRGGVNTDGRLGKMFDKKCDSQFRTNLDPKTYITTVTHKEARTARIPDFDFRHDFEGNPQLVSVAQYGV